MASNATGLLPGQSPALSVISAADHGGLVLIATAVAMSFALISILLRLFIRLDFRQSLGRDDLLAGLSMVSSLLHKVA